MPRTVDNERLSGKPTYDANGRLVEPLVEFNLHNPPTKPIPHLEYPKCVYRYPKEATRQIVEVRGGTTYTQTVPNMAMSKVVQNKQEFDKAIKEGWHKEPWQPPAEIEPGLSNDYE